MTLGKRERGKGDFGESVPEKDISLSIEVVASISLHHFQTSIPYRVKVPMPISVSCRFATHALGRCLA